MEQPPTTDNEFVESEYTKCQTDSIAELAGAICEMQKTELLALTDSLNPFFNSKYANLSSNWDAARKPLTANGLAITQHTEPYPNGVVVVTTLMHKSGEWIRGRLAWEVVPDKHGNRTPQALLSLITYLRRAGVSAIVGTCPDDDDGESLMNREKPEKAKGKKKTPPTLNDDEPILVDYTLPGEDSQAMKDLKEYKPVTTILNKEKTHFKVGKFEVMISEDGKKVWSDVPKFGDNDFDMDACVPCLVSALVRAHGVAFVSGKFGLGFGKEDK